ncbi:hypothetical protein Nepgr_025702 [Nepenthes gracilis]|uniref:FAD-binding FR-type domain-containing protein n=1 Tax=Nepenthes gracilis TaxID=150966 RepID=A0AAD3T6W9_NEPGR|nr:hypothetical protein Nepgr_025702 [Nepenthes gracilis]
MGPHSAQEPLLSRRNRSPNYGQKKAAFFISTAKWIIKFTMLMVFIIWVAFMFFFPSEFVRNLFEKWIQATEGTIYGKTGSLLLAFSGPVFIIAFLAVLYLMIFREEEVEEKKSVKRSSFRLWTFPVLVDGPFGVVSAAEFVGILLFVIFIIWAISVFTVQNWRLLSLYNLPFFLKSSVMLELSGARFGLIGLFCLALLFLPVARGSVLLSFIDIPFEHAIRYHVWLGHLTMCLFTLHGLFYIIAWAMQGRLVQEILEWKDKGIANLAGVISLLAGLLMWVTSVSLVRKKHFELFFYTHQLYVVFVAFLAMHVGDFLFSIAAGGIFLFMLDRFLRFCQSQKTVEVISATSLPCGTLQLIVSKPPNLQYNALSFIFLKVREVSRLQWHPFSVSSSPMDGKYHISIFIKVLGEWTAKLRGRISEIDRDDQTIQLSPLQSQITASVEGPYGHKSSYHLKYNYLVLVAGGIGISPFLAVLSDILHCIEEGKNCMTKNILLVWATKRSIEVPLLYTVNMESICPFFSDVLNLEFRIYVTQESEPPLEEGEAYKTMKSSICPVSKGSGMSVLVGTGDKLWSGIYVVSSTVGFVVILGLLHVFYIIPSDVSSWWYKGLLLVTCMVASVITVGGSVATIWHLWEVNILASEEHEYDRKNSNGIHQAEPVKHENLNQNNHASSSKIRYGCRPDFREIFTSVAEQWGDVDVGVLVCGPPSLESSVAKEIRSQNLKRGHHHPILHFHSHSFDL